MKTIVCVSQKGGTGKTTLAVHLAVAAERAGKSTVIIDLDNQQSAMEWRDLRKEEGPTVQSVQPARLAPTLKAAADAGCELAIIDTPARSENTALDAVRASDLALIPCRPGFFDTAAMKYTANLLKLAGKPGFVVYSQVDGRAAKWRLDDITEALRSYNLTPAPVIVHQLDAYKDGIPAGLAAQEYEPNGKAAAEATALYQWLKSTISNAAK